MTGLCRVRVYDKRIMSLDGGFSTVFPQSYAGMLPATYAAEDEADGAWFNIISGPASPPN